MIQMRWVMHDMTKGNPPTGSICVGDRLYQILQYRRIENRWIEGGFQERWSEWQDVPHSGITV